MIEAGPLFGKLSPGPGMSPQQVASHQRARIHSAMVVLVAERGYGGTTVRELAPAGRRFDAGLPDPFTAEASVGAVWGVLHHQVIHGQARRLPTIAASLAFLAAAPAVGAPVAAQAIRQEQHT